MITTWYHFIRLKFGTLATSQPPPAFPVTGNSSNAVHWAEKCLQSALELITFQCDTFDHLRRTQFGERWVGENWYFEGCLSLLEAAVALVLVLTKIQNRAEARVHGNDENIIPDHKRVF
ncbi:hypothetical protein AGABI1DRAFT_112500 [Agaricus bisporus var. burnettii JB137-S8]|uniref:Uncharacterized protein n=1 Tax=Agaricus bisporus var. burnettii (strain JB137-S8 / ATCC MYA-4627 / FGSC 10392) TaxID=597362 RepID=K5W1T7_AGABU|nr:hypothetical protein AGABI2DRAFT_192468 [Agaricus bisporus var. bisporus H97]XP_007328373.1 uncharacterized protein AGABI1DRAFT_112500 [Agaricus bisporus var. burnettii JB137-S8]EKM80764.1 hypothetical protein AGABI1DRAFT_112500 [Agaricus bisporus var. burnettii JB137-S8]EKV47231.1 hypothetical protein AGABI2DRAFT_192468 [Agaricus bisporus var. bisporus H97]